MSQGLLARIVAFIRVSSPFPHKTYFCYETEYVFKKTYSHNCALINLFCECILDINLYIKTQRILNVEIKVKQKLYGVCGGPTDQIVLVGVA